MCGRVALERLYATWQTLSGLEQSTDFADYDDFKTEYTNETPAPIYPMGFISLSPTFKKGTHRITTTS